MKNSKIFDSSCILALVAFSLSLSNSGFAVPRNEDKGNWKYNVWVNPLSYNDTCVIVHWNFENDTGAIDEYEKYMVGTGWWIYVEPTTSPFSALPTWLYGPYNVLDPYHYGPPDPWAYDNRVPVSDWDKGANWGNILAYKNETGVTRSWTGTFATHYKMGRSKETLDEIDPVVETTITITQTPEPATLALFGLGSLALFRRRRGL